LNLDLEFLRTQGIEVIISLLESPINLAEYRQAGFEAHHFPVDDFTAPEMDQIVEACTVIETALAQGKKVLVHCNAGIGRTGTLLAAFLVHRGGNPEEAVRRVRRERPLSLETSEQVEAVYHYHHLRGRS
jgi:atypical dual specificity phosphatase